MFFGSSSHQQPEFGQLNSPNTGSGLSGFSQSNSGFNQIKSIANNEFLSGGVRDYSALIDPRNLPKDILASEDSDTLDLSDSNTKR